ncbi:hypothetical protein [Nocardia sp. XZ_19_385]|uniref:hypothetical protein n=1 Tax=Nocardia sp. XZ_19_385 TaxID=2769488 RepID=UPI00188F5E72|nr:hypothetical protein [Nocardia sp. XZ_19_385]
MNADYLTEKYQAEIALVSRYSTAPAVIDSTGGEFNAIWALLPNGLKVAASNGEMELDDYEYWNLGIFHDDGGQLAYITADFLEEMLDIAANLTSAQVHALINRSPVIEALPADLHLL